MPRKPSSEEMKQIGDAIAAGYPIEAIKLYREITECDLSEAKEFIDKLTAKMKAAEPGRFAPAQSAQRKLMKVWWTLWVVFLSTALTIYLVLGKQVPPGHASALEGFWIAGLIPAILATIIRWLFLPQFNRFPMVFPIFVVGLALGEISCAIGVALFPAHRELFLAVSLASIAQYAPFFAGKLMR